MCVGKMLSKPLAIFILLVHFRLSDALGQIKCSCICPEIKNLFTYDDMIILFDETGSKPLFSDTNSTQAVDPTDELEDSRTKARTSRHYFIRSNVTKEEDCVCRTQILPYLPKRWTQSVDYCSMCMCNYDKKLKDQASIEHGSIQKTGIQHANIQEGMQIMKDRRNRRAATARPERLWEHGVIPYEIESNFSGTHRALFKQAMRHWELHTCIKFVERTPEHPNYIVFTERPCGCCSFVGKRGNGPQAISIGKNCDKLGIVIHELGHVVGFWHEHTRPDRDTNVQIITKNIMTGQEYNFNKLSEEEISSLGLPYDFASIMHYAKNTFSKNTFLDTILPIENPLLKVRPEIGQRIRLSEGDILQTNLLYRCPKCGKTLQEPVGEILSPERVSANSSNALNCEWRITATQGERIQLKIAEFELHEESNCENNYLEIRDGYWIKEKLIGRYCAKDIVPETLMSSGYRLLLTYHTSGDYEHKGFKINYEFVCGGELSVEDVSLLHSPNYPDDYTPNKECTWVIKTKPNYQIALKFLSFELENSESCIYDYVEVRDGNSENANFLGKFCGLKTPGELHSSGNELFVKFVSDSTVQKGGFASTFNQEYDECAEGSHGCAHSCVNTLGGYRCECKIGFELHSDGKNCEAACGGVIDSENGTLVSPSFPDPYPPNKACIWEIVAPLLYRITLNFTRFDLEGNNLDCGYDSVEVKSKLSANEFRNHGTFCGSRIPQPITSFRNQMRIEFTTDNSVQKTGFSANFFTDLDECSTNNGGCQHICKNTIGSYKCYCQHGFVLHTDRHSCKEGTCMFNLESHSGELSSPNYPGLYESRKTCVWVITTTPGHRVKISFHHFELEIHPQCFYDHLSVYDGDSVSASLVGKFCGNKISNPMIASSNSMYLVFKSDATVQRKGFYGVYSTVCGGKLKATNQVEHLYSHAKYGDADYEKLEDCDWYIEVPANKRIRLKFLTFELEYEQNCSYDYVQVFDGSYDDLVLLLGKYCGNQLPKEMVSTGTSMLVRFHSDDSINSKGFSISYVALDSNDINSD